MSFEETEAFRTAYGAGQARRGDCPRSSHARPHTADKRDVVAWLEATSAGRVPALVPIRYGRMIASPFAFFRGAALIQTADLAAGPHSGLSFQICGDAHLMNFGLFASPERELLFDITDFDETLPGPWEWGLKRLLVSAVLAARHLGFNETVARRIAEEAADAYRRHINEYAHMGRLDLWYSRLSVDKLAAASPDGLDGHLWKMINKAKTRTHAALLPKITHEVNGRLRLVDNPPSLFHVHHEDTLLPDDDAWLATGDWRALVDPMMKRYLETVETSRRALLSGFERVDMAFKVVGVGSVGTRCLVLLMEDDYDQPLFLQIKEARASVLAGFLPASQYKHQGRRVVSGQRLMQAASDLFLGWTQGPAGRHFYVRQLRDMKASVTLESFDETALSAYGRACAWALSRAHAKASGKAAEIAGYFGSGDVLVRALGDYALGYADQVEADYGTFRHAVQQGRLPVETDDLRQDFTP
ncbi:DUF2252 domain-containing protein [Crenobacter cavernae]|uniref:DUF2252 domain-containing protein n=1 Tax=Crenobacter cavernae TaxID=2290923 RepID=A0ABY0FCG8_9NEIS|nr:DUF2252 domain-containing protein [Crenobacter cavernae]RXZ43822.1 DUF2252 domain-containing protein [Crenobacter cavernae]